MTKYKLATVVQIGLLLAVFLFRFFAENFTKKQMSIVMLFYIIIITGNYFWARKYIPQFKSKFSSFVFVFGILVAIFFYLHFQGLIPKSGSIIP